MTPKPDYVVDMDAKLSNVFVVDVLNWAFLGLHKSFNLNATLYIIYSVLVP